jgi:hypothetical protein
MERSSNKTIAGLLSLVALALVAAFALGMWGQAAVSAAPPGQSPLAGQSTQATAADSKNQQLMDSFMAHFTSRLGVDEATLNTAFTGAVNDTLDAAVRDGVITQAEADAAKAKGLAQTGGFRAVLEQGFSSGGSRESGGSPADQYANPKAALIQTMNALGISTDEISQGIEAGKSLAEIAGAHNIDPPTLKNAILTTYKSQLDVAVKNNSVTQAQADGYYSKFAGEIDNILSGKNPTKH